MKTKLCSLVLLASQFTFAAALRGAEGFVAHEWGTFTSVQGADGIQMDWNPLITTELPKFVYDPRKPTGDARRQVISPYAGKSAFRTLQRMETPVIYFYSPNELTVDVTVKFPQGRVTEWFPQARDIGPSFVQPRPVLKEIDRLAGKVGLSQAVNLSSIDTKKSIADSLIRWSDIRVLPAKGARDLAGKLSADTSGSHYYAARATDSDLLRVMARGTNGDHAEFEKFLFYRGVGNFTAPLTVTQSGDADSFVLQNTGKEPLGNLFLYTVRGEKAKHLYVELLAPGASHAVSLRSAQAFAPLSDARADIARRMREALVREGLYEREAAAMVQTWDDSWFAEQGTRVLYTLPRAWTDRILPLTIEPKPRELARVMVGRAELISPDMEWNLLKQVVRFADADPETRGRIIDDTRKLAYGRFMEPTARRLMPKVPGREFSRLSWELLEAASKPAPKDKVVAAK